MHTCTWDHTHAHTQYTHICTQHTHIYTHTHMHAHISRMHARTHACTTHTYIVHLNTKHTSLSFSSPIFMKVMAKFRLTNTLKSELLVC